MQCIIVPGNDVCVLALEEKKYLTTFSGAVQSIVLFLIAAYLTWKREVELIERRRESAMHFYLPRNGITIFI
jgi:hypothetical protein